MLRCVLEWALCSAPHFEVVPVCRGSISRVKPELPVKVLLVKDERQTSAFVLHVVLLIWVDVAGTVGKRRGGGGCSAQLKRLTYKL